MTSTLRERRPEGGPTRFERTRERATQAAAWAQERVPWLSILTAALERERIAAAGLLAGGVAYRLFFWIVPLGLVLAGVLSFWVETDRGGLERAAREFGIGGAAASAGADAIEGGAHSRWYLLLIGGALLVWFSIGVVRALVIAHAVAWRLPPEKLRHPLRAGLTFNATIVLLLLATAATAALRERQPESGLALTLALLALYAAAAVWVSTLLPSRASSWRAFVPGGVLVAVGTQGVHLLAVLYLAPKLGRSSELYGALGTSTVILLWLYLEARLIVAAAFLNAALWERRRPASSP